jgi:hypothetical protein
MPWTRAEKRRNYKKKMFKFKRKATRLKRQARRRLFSVSTNQVLVRLNTRQRILLNAGLRRKLVRFTKKSRNLLKTRQLRQTLLKALLQR